MRSWTLMLTNGIKKAQNELEFVKGREKKSHRNNTTEREEIQ